MNVSGCGRTRTHSFALLRESLGVSRTNHILRVSGHTILQEKRAAEIFDEVGQRSLERLFPGFAEDRLGASHVSAPASRVLGTRGRRGRCRPRTLWSTHCSQIADFLDMIQDAATAGLIPKQPLVARLDAKIEAATAKSLLSMRSRRLGVCGDRIWPGAKLLGARAELRVSCAFRTGKFGKKMDRNVMSK